MAHATSDKSPNGNTRMTAPKPSKGKHKVHRVSIEQADNGGFSVEHHFKPIEGRRGEPSDYKSPETHVFKGAGDMHKHVAKIFPLPAGKGPAAQTAEE